MIATINVNLERCSCDRVLLTSNGARTISHDSACAAKPVLLPCPLPPSATFDVRLGECTCFHRGARNANPPPTWVHTESCTARPVRVSCSIGGETWAESEVTDAEEHGAVSIDAGPQDAMRFAEVLRACRERWALVKALVLGKAWTLADVMAEPVSTLHMNGMLGKRDAVFHALIDAARLSVARNVALNKAVKAAKLDHPYSEELDENSEPVLVLEDYVKSLIEQVGALP